MRSASTRCMSGRRARYLYDRDGNSYADFLAGFGVFGVGRNHPVVRPRSARRPRRRAGRPGPVRLRRCCLACLPSSCSPQAPGLDRVYFCNSGTEAVEAALKFARYATGRPRIVYCDHAFHGLTVGFAVGQRRGGVPARLRPAAAGRQHPLRRASTRSKPSSARATSRRSSSSRSRARASTSRPPGSWPVPASCCTITARCSSATRSRPGSAGPGASSRYQHDDVEPDIVTVAKALSGGFVPVGATLAKDWIFGKVYSSMDRVLVHDSTFGSNAAAMAAGLASLAVIEDEQLVRNAERTGAALQDALAELRREVRAARRGARARADDRPGVRQASLAEAPQPAGTCCRRPGAACSRRWWSARCSSGTASSPRWPATTWT